MMIEEDEMGFLAGGEVITLQPYALENQAFYLPLLKANYIDLLKSEYTAHHVIFNNVLYILIGTSRVCIEKPTFGDTTVRYLNDTTPECVFHATVVLVNSTLALLSDVRISGNNYIDSSSLRVTSYSFLLVDSVCYNGVITSDTLFLHNARCHKCFLDASSITINESVLRNSNINVKSEITVKNSVHVSDINIGLFVGREQRGINSVSLIQLSSLDGSDNWLNVHTSDLIPWGKEEEINIEIRSRIDFSPITTVTGERYSTARARETSMVVGGLLIKHHVDGDYNALQDLGELLFKDKMPYSERSSIQQLILNDFIASIKSRLSVYKYMCDLNLKFYKCNL